MLINKKYLLLLSIILSALLLSACDSLMSEPILTSDKNVISKKLENGFTYHLYNAKNDENGSKMSIRLVIGVGSFQEKDDQKGYAHFVEHLAFYTSKNFSLDQKQRHWAEGAMPFGQHTNAETSYDQTTYLIDEQTSSQIRLAMNLRLLSDVANGILFSDQDVDFEKQIVLQEMLLREEEKDNISVKVSNIYDKNNILISHPPIGLQRTIMSATPKKLRDFYNKWYQPQFMHLVVVGEFDKTNIGKQIEELFGNLPLSKQQKLTNRKIFLPEGNHYLTAQDNVDNSIFLYIPIDKKYFKIQNTKEYIQTIYTDIIDGGLDSHLHRLNDSTGKKYFGLGAEVDWFLDQPFLVIFVQHAKKERIKAIEFLTNALAQLRAEGFSQSQYKRQLGFVEETLIFPYTALKPDGDVWEATFQIVDDIYTNSKHVSLFSEKEQINYFLAQSTTEKVKQALADQLSQKTAMIVISDKEVAPEQQLQMNAIMEKYNAAKLAIIKNQLNQDDFTTKIQNYDGQIGDIISENTIANSNIKHIKLSNGANIYLLHHTENKGDINITVMGKGGSQALPKHLISASYITTDVLLANGLGGLNQEQLGEYLSDNNLEVEPFINSDYHGISINIKDSQNIENAFNILNLALNHPEIHPAQYENLKSHYLDRVKKYNDTAEGQFAQKINEQFYKKGGEYVFDTVDAVQDINKQNILDVYELLFTDLSQLNFVVVGDFNSSNIISYLKKYVASVESKNRSLTQAEFRITDENLNIRSNKNTKDQSIIDIYYSNAQLSDDAATIQTLSMATNIIQARLYEELREKHGFTYHVETTFIYSSLSQHPAEIGISLSVSPENERKVIALVDNIVKQAVASGFTKSEFNWEMDALKKAEALFKESNTDIAAAIASILITTGSVDSFINDDKLMKELTLGKMNQEIKNHFKNSITSTFIFSGK